MAELKVKATTNNVSKIIVNKTAEAQLVKGELERLKIPYTTIVDASHAHTDSLNVTFIIFNSRKHNADLLKIIFDI